MDGEYVTLNEMLDYREEKAALQAFLRKRYAGSVLICLSMNIPGPYKTGESIHTIFELGMKKIETCLLQQGCPAVCKELHERKAGYSAFYVTEGAEARTLKTYMTGIEDEQPVSRLFDIDVHDKEGAQVSREALGLEARKCLICDRPAKECGRSRRHTVQELQEQVDHLIGTCLHESGLNGSESGINSIPRGI